jgi:hypothetical protein
MEASLEEEKLRRRKADIDMMAEKRKMQATLEVIY